MTISQRRGGYAAFTIAATAILMFLTVVVGVGADAISDPTVIAALVMSKLGPLAFIELLKIVQGIATIILVGVIQALWRGARPPLLRTATLAGYGSGVFLILAGVAGLIALGVVAQAPITTGPGVFRLSFVTANALVNWLGRISQIANGFWTIPLGWLSVQQSFLPKGVAYLAIVLGILSVLAALFPPIGVLLLLCAVIWLVWVGRLLVAQRLVTTKADTP